MQFDFDDTRKEIRQANLRTIKELTEKIDELIKATTVELSGDDKILACEGLSSPL